MPLLSYAAPIFKLIYPGIQALQVDIIYTDLYYQYSIGRLFRHYFKVKFHSGCFWYAVVFFRSF